MASLAVVCFGSVHRALGVAAQTCGKLDLAVTHLQAAVAASARLGHRPAALQARAELGIAYVQRVRLATHSAGMLSSRKPWLRPISWA